MNGIFITLFELLIEYILQTVWTAFGEFLVAMQQWSMEIFEIPWIAAAVTLFEYLGWALFIIGSVIAAFDLAIEWQNGRANLKTTALNILKGFFAASLFCIAPVELYKLSLDLQSKFMGDASIIFSQLENWDLNIGDGILAVLGIVNIVLIIAVIICIVKIFCASMKRGGILFIQIAVGSLYMLSVPRGYSDGFHQWIKQVVAICLTGFLQTVMMFLGILTLGSSMIGGLTLLLAASEVPRIAQQFGLDSSVRVSMHSVLYSTSMITNMIKGIAKH